MSGRRGLGEGGGGGGVLPGDDDLWVALCALTPVSTADGPLLQPQTGGGRSIRY